MKRKEAAERKNEVEIFFLISQNCINNSTCLAPSTMLGTVDKIQKGDLDRCCIFGPDVLIRRIKHQNLYKKEPLYEQKSMAKLGCEFGGS